jgi:hypothetical protein
MSAKLVVPVERIEILTLGLQNRCFRNQNMDWLEPCCCFAGSQAMLHNVRSEQFMPGHGHVLVVHRYDQRVGRF